MDICVIASDDAGNGKIFDKGYRIKMLYKKTCWESASAANRKDARSLVVLATPE